MMETNLTESFFDHIGKSYEDAYIHAPPLQALLLKASSDLPLNSNILDVGSGTGKPVASLLSAAGHHVHGIDRSQVMVSLASQQVPGATFEHADMLTWIPPASEPKYDAVFATFIFFALARPQYTELLAKFAAWLTLHGRLYVGTIAANDYDADPAWPIGEDMWDADGMFVQGVQHMFMRERVRISMLTREG